MKIVIASDHGGFDLKQALISYLEQMGYDVTDLGCPDKTSVDYPDYSYAASTAVAEGKFEKGIVICTTGVGVSICANKVHGIRCALCTNVRTAELSRMHNDANVLALGAINVDSELGKEIVKTWLTTEFEGGRHSRRVGKIMNYEHQYEEA